MLYTFAIASGVRDRIIEEFSLRQQAEDFLNRHLARKRMVLRSFDIQHALWTVHVREADATFCFRTAQCATAFIDRNVTAELARHAGMPELGNFCAVNHSDRLAALVESIRDRFEIERCFVMQNGRMIREWRLSQESESVDAPL